MGRPRFEQVTDPLLPVGDGHTELPEDDRFELIPTYIATRGELYAAEQRNIVEALLRRGPTAEQLLEVEYLRKLHRAMFGQVWKWAGTLRTRSTNLGVDPTVASIAGEVRTLVDDAKAWVKLGIYEPDELAVRFHHRLVSIHPFPNGNGRHGRIAADYLVAALGREPFTWGSRRTATTEELRGAYRRALQRADRDPDDIAELVAFARS